MTNTRRFIVAPIISSIILWTVGGISHPQQASSKAVGEGDFIGPYHETVGSTLALTLRATFSLKENESPGLTYVTTNTLQAKQFAYVCVVHHDYQGKESDTFPFKLQVTDDIGTCVHSFNIGGSSVKILYSITVPQNHCLPADESLEICGTPVDLTKGRVFVINMTLPRLVVTQVAVPLPIPSDSRTALNVTNEVMKTVLQMRENDPRSEVLELKKKYCE